MYLFLLSLSKGSFVTVFVVVGGNIDNLYVEKRSFKCQYCTVKNIMTCDNHQDNLAK